MEDVCAKCGELHDIAALDSKPKLTLRLRLIKRLHGQLYMLQYAGDRGYDFNRLECSKCYGPGYEEL